MLVTMIVLAGLLAESVPSSLCHAYGVQRRLRGKGKLDFLLKLAPGRCHFDVGLEKLYKNDIFEKAKFQLIEHFH